ncbi:sodium-dependent glucose transporter 1A-like [Mytilus edulis]|uniref:sodium-dependent glucose transporter 1A-like n=1 Tax=Mytilus edulis TaxID=6550 RepID=UPI0039EF9E0B
MVKMAEEEKVGQTTLTTTEKVVKTIFLVLTWVMIGLFTEITGPTQKDLIIKTSSDYELVSRAISGRSAGYFIGAVIGGPLVDKLGHYCDLMIAVCLDGAAIATVIVPYCGNVSLLWFLLALGGTFEGVINIAGQKIILNIWQEKATGPMHVLHFGFGMGSFIVPQILNPFLAVLSPSPDNITETANITSVSFVSPTIASNGTELYLKESRIETGYLIIGIIVASLSVVFYIYQCFFRQLAGVRKILNGNDTLVRQIVKVVDPATCSKGDRWFGVQVFFLLFMYFFNQVGGDRLYGKFIRSYAIDKHKFSGDNGSLLNTEFWISFAVGRFFGLFTGRYIPIRVLILIEVFGAFITVILLEIFARDSDLALWILTASMGFFVAPLFPSGIAWGDFHVEFTGFAITFVLMGGALGGMSYLWVIGYLYEYYGYDMFLHQLVVYAIIMIFLTMLMTIVGKRHGGRFENRVSEVNVNELSMKKN